MGQDGDVVLPARGEAEERVELISGPKGVYHGWFHRISRNAQRSASQSKGVFLVKMKNVFVPVKRVYSVNTYSRISTVPRGSEGSE